MLDLVHSPNLLVPKTCQNQCIAKIRSKVWDVFKPYEVQRDISGVEEKAIGGKRKRNVSDQRKKQKVHDSNGWVQPNRLEVIEFATWDRKYMRGSTTLYHVSAPHDTYNTIFVGMPSDTNAGRWCPLSQKLHNCNSGGQKFQFWRTNDSGELKYRCYACGEMYVKDFVAS